MGTYVLKKNSVTQLQKNIKKPKRFRKNEVLEMSKRKFFEDVIALFKGYENTKKGLNAEYEKLKETGMYSRQFLNDSAMANDKKLRAENSRIILRIGEIKENFLKELDAEFDLTASKPDAGLQALVNSGIAPTKEEFANLAQKYKGNYVNSRLLHDFADRSGYILRNIVTREEAVQAFDNFVHGVVSSMYTSSIPVYPDSGYAKIKADGHLFDLENPAMDCHKKPETFEETITQAAMMENADRERTRPEFDDEAFLRGFWGMNKKEKQQKQEIPGELGDRIKALSEEERADALYMAIYHGHAGEITRQEIDFIQSADYKRLVEERNAQNDKGTE